MLINMLCVPYADVRCAVEEGAVLLRVQGEPQLAIGFGESVPLYDPPYTVQLIVGVNRAPRIKMVE